MADETMQTPETIPTPTPAMAEASVLTSDLAASQSNHQAPNAEAEAPPVEPTPEVPTYGEFKLPDGASVDGEQLEQATALFKEAGLPHEQAQKFIDLALSREQAAATRGVQAFVDLQTKWVSEIKADPEIGGTKFEASMASASRAIDRLGVPGLKEALNLAVGQYVITGGFLHVNIGRAPIASDTFEIPNGNNNQIYINALTNIALDRIAIRFSSADGVLISFAADTVTITNCDFANCNGGLIHATQGIAPATNLRIQSNYLHDQNCNQQNAVALHGATTATVLNNRIARISGWGITSSDTSVVDVHANVLDGAKMYVVSDGAGGGTHSFVGNQMVNEPPEGGDHDPLFYIDGSVMPSTVINIYNHSQALGVHTHALRAIRADSGAVMARNIALWGAYEFNFMVGLANGTIDSDFIATGGGPIFNWPHGAHDLALAADPYMNAARNDLSPAVGSPLIGAGVALGTSTMPSRPDIGYTGAATSTVPPAVADVSLFELLFNKVAGLFGLANATAR